MSDYKNTRTGLLNTERRIYKGVGPYDIPEMDPIEADVTGLEAVGFNYFRGEKHPEGKVLHFFLDDYQFERVWKVPEVYLPKICRFDYVIAPDFSLYTDHPKAVQIFNHYRKHWCAKYWQEHGARVIPCMCWSTPDSYKWCFDGTPKHSTVCVSTIGGFGNHDNITEGYLQGFREMYCQIEPSHVILFGKEYDEIKEIIGGRSKVSVMRNEQLHRKATLSAKSVEDGIQIPVIETEVIEDGREKR